MDNEYKEPIPMWADDVNCAITVCDTEGVILYMNLRSVDTFGDKTGENLMGCHNPHSRALIAHMIETGESNSYTITKNGRKKVIYQTPWRKGGKVAGLVEISMIVPDDMPHYNRDEQGIKKS
ncbi:MAG: PAS sensor protein [Muribaculaceae bacterium]|nr:PAS sensor protein [Muribaculaceae bacterium]